MTEPKNKDKECPFCRQYFTASSLGRHLDVFIKEKNAKPADDVHNVEDIKRLRAGITRRQPRQSLQRLTPLSGDVSPAPSTNDEKSNEDNDTFKTYFNRPGWEATGVITDVPTLSRTIPNGNPPLRGRSSNGSVKEQVVRRQGQVDLIDHARAAELALQEVLESLRVAKQRADTDPPFDFNFFGLNLPQMYLRCLGPPPALLNRPSQRPVDLAWSVEPPSAAQCEALRAWLAGKISDWKRRRENLGFNSDQIRNTTPGQEKGLWCLKQEEAGYYDHLESTFSAWVKLSDAERQDHWHLECARALALETEAHLETKQKLEQAEQEVQILRGRLEHISLNGEDASRLSGTEVILLNRQTAARLATAPNDLDHTKLISKWKTRLQSARSAQHPLPTSTTAPMTNGQHSRFEEVAATSPVVHVSGSEDAELEDAPGEVDSDHFQDQNDANKSSFGARDRGRLSNI